MALVLASAFASADLIANPGDVFYYTGQTSDPPDPTYDQNEEGWKWDGWQPLNILPYDFSIGSGVSVWLGLANEEFPNWWKNVTLEFSSGEGIVLSDFRAGYQDGSTVDWMMDEVPHQGDYKRWQGWIFHQPGWEWVRFDNISQDPQTFIIGSFTSECIIPEPMSVTLLALGLAGLGIRRFRR